MEAAMSRACPLHGARRTAPRPSASLPPVVALLLLVSALVLSVAPARAAFDQIGGDDVRVATFTAMPADQHSLDITTTGDAYLAAADTVAGVPLIRVYVSRDHGTVWTLWGTLTGAGLTGGPPGSATRPCLHIAEGTENLVFVAFEATSGSSSESAIRVAVAPLAGTLASFITVTALASTGVDFHRPSLTSDARTSDPYTLHLVAEGDDGNGTDVWYTRSTDFDATWEAGYRIASAALLGVAYRTPQVRYGLGGVVHAVWQNWSLFGDEGIRYRRALNGGATAADWQTPVDITATSDGYDDSAPSVAASNVGAQVLVTYQRGTVGDGVSPFVHGSSDAGATWPAGSRMVLTGLEYPGLYALPGGGFVCLAQSPAELLGVKESSESVPLGFTALQTPLDRAYDDGVTHGPGLAMACDPTEGGRMAVVWSRLGATADAPDTLFFDAESRADPGYLLFEPGMPVMLPTEPSSHPGICELDGDDSGEIVWGDSLGYIRAYNHDGSVVPGWPQRVSNGPLPSPVAVGDLDGDDRMEVVVGDMQGNVHAYHNDGTPLDHFPRSVGVTTTARVSIGSVVTGSARQIVVTFLNYVGVMMPNGAWATGWPVTKSFPTSGIAAIGDVDADGANEVVTLCGPMMTVNERNGTLSASRSIAASGRTFLRAPALADLDRDGYLEIAASTNDGSLYVMNHVGADLTALWPWTGVALEAASQPTLSQFMLEGTLDVLTMVRTATGNEVRVFTANGNPIYPWPQSAGAAHAPNPIVTDRWSSIYSVFGESDGMPMGWWNISTHVDGMPKQVPGRVDLAPASGMLDGSSSHMNLVYLTNSPPSLCVMDIGFYQDHFTVAPDGWWPQYGYNHERQSCLACGVDAVTSVDTGAPIAAVRLEAPRPNPSRGALTLRWALPRPAPVRLELFDASGRRVRRLLKVEQSAGVHELTWDGRLDGGVTAPAGVYFAHLSVAGERPLDARIVRMP
jgi:hypothetical protein